MKRHVFLRRRYRWVQNFEGKMWKSLSKYSWFILLRQVSSRIHRGTRWSVFRSVAALWAPWISFHNIEKISHNFPIIFSGPRPPHFTPAGLKKRGTGDEKESLWQHFKNCIMTKLTGHELMAATQNKHCQMPMFFLRKFSPYLQNERRIHRAERRLNIFLWYELLSIHSNYFSTCQPQTNVIAKRMKSVMKVTATVLRPMTEMSLENVSLWITVRASVNVWSGVKALIFVPLGLSSRSQKRPLVSRTRTTMWTTTRRREVQEG